jgi:acetyltransferase-like isoleucine patch superfamily enzyme
MKRLRDVISFRLRLGIARRIVGLWRRLYWGAQGMWVGRDTVLPRLHVTWPHQVQIGEDCSLEANIAFKFDGPWRPGPGIVIGDRVFVGRDCEFNIQEKIEIGADVLIGAGCRFVDHDHGIALDRPIAEQRCTMGAIRIGQGAWLGANVIVLRGVSIGEGAIVGAGAVVRQDIPAREIWAGVPARRIGSRDGKCI